MARALAIRSITTDKTGRVEVAYSSGEAVADSGPTGSIIFQSEKHLHDEIKNLDRSLSDHQLLLMTLASTWLERGGTFGDAKAVEGKELRLDTFDAQPMKVVG